MKTQKFVLLIAVLSLVEVRIDGATAVVMADQGRARLPIFVPVKASPTAVPAAGELQHYLSAMSGAHFDLVTNQPKGAFILVCPREAVPAGLAVPTRAGQLQPEGYCLTSQAGNVFVVGADARGTLYGVYDLLERLGCRWLAPSFSFYQGAHEFVPKSDRLVLSLAAEVIENPVFQYRKLYVEEGHSHNLENLRQMIAWMPKRRFNTLVIPLNYGGRGRVMWDNWREALTPDLRQHDIVIEVGGHGYENYLNAEMEGGQLFEQHPEWFNLDNRGKRSKNTHAVFCTSNPNARSYFIRSVLRYLATHPEIEIFDFWPPDGARWCQCTNCQALGAPSDRQAILLAEVAAAAQKAHPKLKFETIAYAGCLAPPTKAGLEPTVLLDFCPIGQCFEFQIHDPQSKANAAYVGQLKAWCEAFHGGISIYSYYRKYAWRSLPVLLPHYMQSDLRFYRTMGVRGISSYAEPGDWATYELNHYVLGALAWNPEADVEAIVGEFSEARFGAQAGLARKAYQVLEETVRHLCSLPGTELKPVEDYRRAAGVLDALDRELETAAAGLANKPSVTALNRLEWTVDYARRDLLLQQGQVEHSDVGQRTVALENLGRFLEAHASDGVFVTERIPVTRKAAQ